LKICCLETKYKVALQLIANRRIEGLTPGSEQEEMIRRAVEDAKEKKQIAELNLPSPAACLLPDAYSLLALPYVLRYGDGGGGSPF
jgi:hypothetical protein